MANQILGSAVLRREDPEFLRGEAKFTEDVALPGMLHMAILHSPHAHARIKGIDKSKAERLPGVVRVFTGADIASLPPLPVMIVPPGADLHLPPHPFGIPGGQPVLTRDKARYEGDWVAVAVAESREQALAAVDAIEVDYEPLPAVLTAEAALQPDAPQLYDAVPGNLAQHVGYGDKAKAEAAIAAAEVIVRKRLVIPELIHNALEVRASIGAYEPHTGDFTLWTSTQITHGTRFIVSQMVLGIPYNKLRVIASNVGGGFGSKGYVYPDQVLVLFIARQLSRPVKWVDTRHGLPRSTVHARNQVHDATLAGTRDGRIIALTSTNHATLGGYASTIGPGLPTSLTGRSITGSYAIPNPYSEIYLAVTNTAPTGPMRGAGRNEAIFVIERMVDLFAKEIGMDPVEVRRKNLIRPDQFPYPNGLGWIYDSGNYEPALDKALAEIGYGSIAERKAEARARGKRLGIGVGCFTAVSGVGPSPAMGSVVGMNGGTWGSTLLRVHPTGEVTFTLGTQPHGQSHVTTFSQIVAQELGVAMDRIEVLHSDTRGVPFGQGSYGSRSFSVEGSAVYLACQKIIDKARTMAAHMLKVSKDDIVADAGTFSVRGKTVDQSRTLAQIALALWYSWDLPPGLEPGLEASAYFDPPNFNFPSGSHAAVVEIDETTGQVEVVRYVAVNDFGNVGNPMVIDGQVHGNTYLGISQALFERCQYDADGRIATDSFMTYATARASQLPFFESHRLVTPTNTNPLGAKGAGDTGTPVTLAVIVSAVCNALADLGITHLEPPLKPETVWRAMQEAAARG